MPSRYGGDKVVAGIMASRDVDRLQNDLLVQEAWTADG
jgi:hypothetical protein